MQEKNCCVIGYGEIPADKLDAVKLGLKKGGRTVGEVASRVHIAPVEKKAIEKLEKGIKGAAENAT